MYNVLIVEDNDIILKGLRRMIEGMNINEIDRIFEAPDGRDALRFWKNLKPEIILSDIKMTHMDGLEFISCVRKYDSRTRFIIISGYSDFNYAQKAISYEVSEYLIKPVNREKLKGSLNALISKLKHLDASYQRKLHTPREKVNFDNAAIDTIVSYIYEHYRDNISLNMAANIVYMNPNYFSTLFKKVTGMNFIKYIQKVRTEKAKELLVQLDLKVYDVSKFVGFSNEKYFFKVFKEFEGITPSDYRYQHRMQGDYQDSF